jgi:glycine/D-amino acid oxidase-like deaminating enzyme
MSYPITQSHAQPSPSPTSLTTASQIVIAGAGTFGLSTAFHLLGRGYTHVTVLDRARELPAVDAAGTDINKGACRHRLGDCLQQ